MRADIYNDIQISFSIIHPSVCLSDWLLSEGGERVDLSLYIYIYTYILIILSIDKLYTQQKIALKTKFVYQKLCFHAVN